MVLWLVLVALYFVEPDSQSGPAAAI